ncbi:acyl-CoA reductase [Muricauda sp. JGD-17]|uniref:Acyl-CoA reductase n=1 Tax=Flagellimonas ochracea TaxID=2696472 RepID=A0A964TCL8_9FLAO|nr:acyl-CoA reductase [Allomuricauda ochracea]NAY91036.1 acyl-CoA reductase [Allomuricauda ochracea]
MRHPAILEAFVKLGSFIRDFCENHNRDDSSLDDNFIRTITLAEQQNGWFTRNNILYALEQWSALLTKENLEQWLSKYSIDDNVTPKTIGIVMAGNIPLVGFHDFICVLLTGNKVLAKLSSNDKILLPFLVDFLVKQELKFKEKISFVEGKFKDFDAIIATGSNNTSRYFEYYFSKGPNIIRKNRNSVAILTGNESKGQLVALGEDIFRYFGLGCRNVSKIFVPKGYNFNVLFDALFSYKHVIDHHKYANNYDYNKAVYLMSDFKILDNGFLLLKEDKSLSSPIAALFYTYYDSEKTLREELNNQKEALQCIVSDGSKETDISFGDTQKPTLDEYADGVDTMEFLINL